MYIAAILVSVIFYFAGIWSPSMAADQTHPLKIGFVCVGPVNDYGWNQAHNQARLYLEKQLPGQVQTTLAEKISEGSEAERVMERMIAQGNRLIFSTSYGYMEPMLRVAARHPDIIFMQMNRLQTTKNVGTYSQMQYQPMYLAGMVAGHMTKTNKLGFVSAHPVPPMVQSINSFTLGARSVNPKAQTRVVWTNSWSDQMLEAEAAKGLAESGVDVICGEQDNQTTILKTCENLNVRVVGFYVDGHEMAPKCWICGANLNWGPFYVKIVKSVLDHSWKPAVCMPGIESDSARLSEFGKAVPEPVRKEVLAKETLLKQGKFDIFKGPLKDTEGRLRIPAGRNPDLKQLAEMDWLVDGVQAPTPKK